MKLATIQRITKLEPIPNAESIEKACVLGWEVVVKKGQFKEGDMCIYVQIDTVMPDKPEFAFLSERKFRVRTIKLRGQISQGLIIPLPDKGVFFEGEDVTNFIGVKKYEKPDTDPSVYLSEKTPHGFFERALYKFKFLYLYKWFPFMRKKLRSPFPSKIVPITDEERIQNIPHYLEKYKGLEFIVSYKLDGSSITIIHHKFLGRSSYRICSRRFELHDSSNDWYKVFKKTSFDKEIQKLVSYFNTNNIVVQGEAIGKFNGNHHNLSSNEIRLFNIFVEGDKLYQDKFIEVCEKLNIPHCPLYKKITLNHTMKEIIEESNLKDILNPKAYSEGLVWRRENISFKVVNPNYLLKKEE